ncbi:MAG: hypothetical protein IJI46_06675 [Erysipelotrichaceae bacterium]|nr:hypothetical protein [Erysipelotrichaceae bacterium]
MNRYERSDSTSYCLGTSLTIEALKHKSDAMIEVLLSEKAHRNEQFSYLIELCEKNDVHYRYDERSIEKLSVKENCYCIGVFNKYAGKLSNKPHVGLIGFNDYGELGTVLRSAVCFDFHDIALIGSDIDHFDPRCIRASMGSIFHCDIISFKDLDEYKEKHPDHHLYPFVSRGKREISDVCFTEPYTLLISQKYDGLDEMFTDGIRIDHKELAEISLPIRSSIILETAYALKRRR